MRATIQYIEKELAGLYPNTEITGFTRIIIEAVCGWGFTTQIVKMQEKITEADFEKIKEIVLRLKMFEPIQYILGETEFYGLKLVVSPSVLIQSNLKFNSKILDIGTGSGCIALALKSRLKEFVISGMDISEKALEIARRNALDNFLDVDFFQADILSWKDFEWGIYDVIVSNPPYIRESEKPEMHTNVLMYEPENALFVPESDPLVFYRSIAAFAKKHLAKNGMLFFEINENLGAEMKELLLDSGFCEIEIRKDINGKNRMVGCRNNI